MKKLFAALGVVGLIGVATPSTAMAGGALATELLPTANAIDCATTTPCESDGFGAVASLKIMGINNMGFVMQGMLPLQTYVACHNAGGGDGCGSVVATFNTQGDGTADFVVPLLAAPDTGDSVVIFRQDDSYTDPTDPAGAIIVVLVPTYSGTLGRLNGR